MNYSIYRKPFSHTQVMFFSISACISSCTPALLQTPILRSVRSLFSGLYRPLCLSAFKTFAKDTHLYMSILRSLTITISSCPCYGLCRTLPCTPILRSVMSHYSIYQTNTAVSYRWLRMPIFVPLSTLQFICRP